MPATADISNPVADPVSELRLMIITSEKKLVLRFRSNAKTHNVTNRSDWKNPIITSLFALTDVVVYNSELTGHSARSTVFLLSYYFLR